MASNDAWTAREGMERLHAEAAKGVCQAKKDACLQCILVYVTDVGFTLYEFLDELMHMRDHTTSFQVSQMLVWKGCSLLGSICQCCSEIIHTLVVWTTGEILAQSLQIVMGWAGPNPDKGLKWAWAWPEISEAQALGSSQPGLRHFYIGLQILIEHGLQQYLKSFWESHTHFEDL